jgi:hypothetical protein
MARWYVYLCACLCEFTCTHICVFTRTWERDLLGCVERVHCIFVRKYVHAYIRE